ncbi:MAG: DUF2231 domain-containing protein, partial [Akkermansiaceae bacterium]|nr:DUF2231 domain-containing protein [Armatimonadota bacterium]
MESRAKFLGHSLHQMLIVFPLGLLVTSVLFDVAGALSSSAEMYRVAYWMITVGVLSGLLAAVAGWMDWAAIPTGTRAKAVGLSHGLANTVMLSAFALSWWVRYSTNPARPSVLAVVLSFLALGVGMFAAWLGGELVNRLGVGIDNGANLNAPSSLSGKPATETPVPLVESASSAP